MGQATLDLPDPSPLSGLDAGPLSPEALASADDLLSQLAGDDIDRLLAEAEAERASETPLPEPPPPPFPAPVAQTSDQPAATAAVPESAPQSAAELAPQSAAAASAESQLTSAGAGAPSPSAAEADIDAVLASALESTIEGSDATPAPELASSPALSPTVDAAPAERVSETAAPAVSPVATTVPEEQPTASSDQMELDEAAAHVASIMDPPPAEPATPAVPDVTADAAERQALDGPLVIRAADPKPSKPLWLILKLLQLINWPMTLVSDDVREAMGKIAILTMFNAAAVLVYVLVFRRPHH